MVGAPKVNGVAKGFCVSERPVIAFASSDLAQQLVAGLPACARACIVAQSLSPPVAKTTLVLLVPGELDQSCRSELDRLVPGRYTFAVAGAAPANSGARWVAGEALVLVGANAGGQLTAPVGDIDAIHSYYAANPESVLAVRLGRASRAYVEQTGKTGDGVVSRHLNRRVSMALSTALLRFAWIRPGHATILTAVIALAMVCSLLSGTTVGLVAGAILFQLASIVDGVDGEIARATLRSSARGAMLDTVTDGFTNVGFIAGLAINLAMRGEYLALEMGLIGAGCLAVGCIILATQSIFDGANVSFDAVGIWMTREPGALRRVLVAVTKRDFFALASMVLILASLDRHLLLILSGACVSWLVLVLYVTAVQKLDKSTT